MTPTDLKCLIPREETPGGNTGEAGEEEIRQNDSGSVEQMLRKRNSSITKQQVSNDFKINQEFQEFIWHNQMIIFNAVAIS